MTPAKVTLNHLVKSFSMTFPNHDESCSEYAQNLRKLDILDEKWNKQKLHSLPVSRRTDFGCLQNDRSNSLRYCLATIYDHPTDFLLESHSLPFL